ncbi:branched-chain amino acid ABC transporter permease (plasmid) [Cupriavidus necator]|uniref:Branched-chain amino acid ABC transporter permease n=1 Tax=Cupriavidus necator TaxID=106590 RepID=A0A367PR60_CUPNE|nr:branched-chain amino acid ABC transporter permease [Cupriavidus necator]QQX89440.1 branched-chain amino acid ABC transporter permease [Cupriavidus necator]RCJ10400.1 branched-chain amino acid ABC transporter permease [Cupriavidus necator]
MQTSSLVAQALVNGVIIGLLYLLMAIGFTLVFGVMRIVNFAHGEFYMLGAFFAYLLVSRFQLPFVAAVGAAFVLAVVLGWVIEELVLKPFRHDELNGMIATIGLAMILQAVALMAFGPDPQFMPSVADGSVTLGAVSLPMSRLYVVGFSVAVLLTLYVFLGHTRTGRALRAVVQDTEIATAQGVRARLMYPLGFGIGVGLAAIAGALMAPLFSVSPFIGATPLLKAFIVVILGGLGSIPGAALASLLLGVTESAASTFISNSIAEILIFALVMAMLVIRPTGLLGRAET